MQVLVAGSDVVVASQLSEARSAVARTRGLMFRRTLPEGAALNIRPCGSIHMMFMRFPIDAVFYDRENRVTKVARRLRPWVGLAFGGRGAAGVIELTAGAAGAVQPGDVLVFQPAMAGAPQG